MIIKGSGLSFLGLGVLPPDPDWGSMFSVGKEVLEVAPYVATIPGLLIFLLALSLNLMGDGLRHKAIASAGLVVHEAEIMLAREGWWYHGFPLSAWQARRCWCGTSTPMIPPKTRWG